MVRASGVSKRFKVREGRGSTAGDNGVMTALDNVSVDVRRSEFLTLLGPSGCGKTTLLRMLAGLLTADEGEISIDGKLITGPRRDACMVFQDFGLLPWRTVLGNVEFPLELDGTAKEERHRIARQYLDVVGLGGFQNHYPHELSGGMQQRVGIARALMRKPILLLMDEPFGALDAQTREQLQEDFLKIWSNLRTTVVFVTHSIDEALALSDRIIVFTPRPGRIRGILESPLADVRGQGDMRSHPDFVAARTQVRDMLRSGS